MVVIAVCVVRFLVGKWTLVADCVEECFVAGMGECFVVAAAAADTVATGESNCSFVFVGFVESSATLFSD